MLKDDCEIVEGYFDFVCIRPSIRDAWNRIKDFVKVQNKTHNKVMNTICPKCSTDTSHEE
jgi:hypothetical protein